MSAKTVNPHKVSVVSDIKDLLSHSKSVAVIDFQGLKVSQVTELRQAIKKAGGKYLVAKNTLFKIASGLTDLKLEGISGFVFSTTDEVSAIKAVADFAKKNTQPTFKLGLLGTTILSQTEITKLASLPDRPTLVSKLLGSLNSPVTKLVYNLNWNLGKLVRTLDAVAKSKEVN